MNGSLLQQIIAQGLPYLEKKTITPRQWQVLHHLQDCRTQAIGSYQWHCNHCEQDTQWYCSCRDRHCPVCQGKAREKWRLKRQADVLPVAYHHVVFTLPHQFNGWQHYTQRYFIKCYSRLCGKHYVNSPTRDITWRGN